MVLGPVQMFYTNKCFLICKGIRITLEPVQSISCYSHGNDFVFTLIVINALLSSEMLISVILFRDIFCRRTELHEQDGQHTLVYVSI